MSCIESFLVVICAPVGAVVLVGLILESLDNYPAFKFNYACPVS